MVRPTKYRHWISRKERVANRNIRGTTVNRRRLQCLPASHIAIGLVGAERDRRHPHHRA
jgi:hypothetical protein